MLSYLSKAFGGLTCYTNGVIYYGTKGCGTALSGSHYIICSNPSELVLLMVGTIMRPDLTRESPRYF